MKPRRSPTAILLSLLMTACSKDEAVSDPGQSSAEASAIAAAAALAMTNSPEDALNLAESALSRGDLSAEDRAAAAKAHQTALKKLSAAAAAGDAEAEAAMNKYRARK